MNISIDNQAPESLADVFAALERSEAAAAAMRDAIRSALLVWPRQATEPPVLHEARAGLEAALAFSAGAQLLCEMHTWRQAVKLLDQAGVMLVERSATLNDDGAPTRGEWVWERLRGRAYEGKEMSGAARIAAVRWLLDLLCWERLRVCNCRPRAGVGATIAPLHKQVSAHGVSSESSRHAHMGIYRGRLVLLLGALRRWPRDEMIVLLTFGIGLFSCVLRVSWRR